ncbi:transmembrane protease serine 9 isoform X3 [Plutella xylostella]|uniref:transmembrane protease serine 9 isoform X3 n=1 Tax=Plutella xylostella TaxID=51655 RepID=UPI002032D2D3|nr:transmembrane protease serine 9 isoform X3 [Plutella xylostella]
MFIYYYFIILSFIVQCFALSDSNPFEAQDKGVWNSISHLNHVRWRRSAQTPTVFQSIGNWFKKNFSGGRKNTATEAPDPQSPKCELPGFPEHGYYSASAAAAPGARVRFISLNYSCHAGYQLEGPAEVFCHDGAWRNNPPRCIHRCTLDLDNPSVEYHCQVPDSNGGWRGCRRHEPEGTVVEAQCRPPYFYSPSGVAVITCVRGEWTEMTPCLPDCGRVTTAGTGLVAGGRSARRGELPWHVAVYRKDSEPYRQVCGGSIVSPALVISAAHCFWDDTLKLLDAAIFAVAAGKIYSPWNETHDDGARHTNVTNIVVPDKFYGAETNYDYDLALVFVEKPFVYQNNIRPVCVNFNPVLEAEQLRAGSYGKVAGWGLTGRNSSSSTVLKVVSLPFMDEGTCLAAAPTGYRDLVTSQKFCAGSEDSKTVCKGDSGGGFVFPSKELGVVRHYLRGVVSTAPKSFDACNIGTITTFFHLSKLEAYIRPYLTLKSYTPVHGGKSSGSCKLRSDDPYIDYLCLISVSDPQRRNSQGYRPCATFEANGTVVEVRCNSPVHSLQSQNQFVTCRDGYWDFEPKCILECGRTDFNEAVPLASVTSRPPHNLAPWRAGVYLLRDEGYMLICEASILKEKLIITAAHCFWDQSSKSSRSEKLFAVAVNKQHRAWDDIRDAPYEQKRNVSRIVYPANFTGSATKYAEDLALVHLSAPIKFHTSVLPICVDLNDVFERFTFSNEATSVGQMIGWGFESRDAPAEEVHMSDYEYLTPAACRARRPEITHIMAPTKFCAAVKDGGLVCKGDSGAGLVFPAVEKGVTRHYLRGVASSMLFNGDVCSKAIVLFTQVTKMKQFFYLNS